MRFVVLTCAALLLVAAACSGGSDDDDGPTQTSTGSPVVTLDPLHRDLSSVLLTAADLPEGLEGGGLSFSTNEQLAQTPEELARLNQLGRLLGVDLSFVPSPDLPDDSPLRGGVQSAASVYTNPDGASTTFNEIVAAARSTDWAQSYQELTDVQVRELDQTVGDESVWLRITGIDTCIIETPPGAPPTEMASVTCPPSHLIVDDYVVFRTGRVRALVKVLTSHPLDSLPDEVYVEEVQGWADLTAERGMQAFPLVP